ncbi:MAG: DNA polymerase III subunit delta [Eubacteriales bacterium]
MEGLLQDLKTNQIKQVYLLFGEEDYLRKQYRDRVREKLVEQGDTMNYTYLEGKNHEIGGVIDLAETLPFFAERRVIIWENSGLLKKGGEQLAQYLEEIVDTTYFILVEKEIDKRSKLFKTLKKKGRVCEFGIQNEATLKRWILSILKRENKKITELTMNVLLDKTGTDMEIIKTELEKLICYTIEKEEITKEDVETIVTHRVSNQIFDMINAMADKNQKKALDLYYDLLTLKEPPLRILALISRTFHLLMQVKILKGKGHSDKVIGEQVGLHSFVVSKYAKQVNRFSAKELRNAVESCVEAEENVKTGKMNDKMSIELLIVKLSQSNGDL